MTLSLKPLDQQVTMITGASSGSRLVTAQAAAAAGASVVLVARGEDTLAVVAADIEAAATTPTRDVKVGLVAKRNTTMHQLLPSPAEKVEPMQASRQQYDEPPRHPDGALYQPGGSEHVRGSGGVAP